MTISYRHWIRQAQQGDEQAVLDIFEQFEGMLVNAMNDYRNILGDAAEIEAIALFGLVDGIHTYDLTCDHPVERHLYNCVRKHFNRASRQIQSQNRYVQKDFYDAPSGKWTDYPFHIIDPDMISPDKIYILKEMRCLLRLGMDILDQQERQVIILRYYENCTFIEIGRRMGLYRKTVSIIHDRACWKLAEFLKKNKVTRKDKKLWDDMIESKGRVFEKKDYTS